MTIDVEDFEIDRDLYVAYVQPQLELQLQPIQMTAAIPGHYGTGTGTHSGN